MRKTWFTIAQEHGKYIFHHGAFQRIERELGSTYRRSIELAGLLTLGQPSREPTPPGKLACRQAFNSSRKPHQAFSSNMPFGTYHNREDNAICGSESNHHKTHQPKDEAGVVWQKNFNTCLPMYKDKDREQKFKHVAEKMNSDFQLKKKAGQCFPSYK